MILVQNRQQLLNGNKEIKDIVRALIYLTGENELKIKIILRKVTKNAYIDYS